MVPVIADPGAPGTHEVLHFAWARNRAVCRGDWKLIGTFDAKARTTVVSLHHLADPKPELKDHANEQAEIVRQLMALHEAWAKDLEGK